MNAIVDPIVHRVTVATAVVVAALGSIVIRLAGRTSARPNGHERMSS